MEKSKESDIFADAYKYLDSVKPLTHEEMKRIEKEVIQKPEMQKLYKEIDRLHFINDIFDGKYDVTEKDGKMIATLKEGKDNGQD